MEVLFMKKLVTVISFAMALLFLFVVICPSGYAAEKVITLKFSDLFPAMHKVALLKAEWCKEVEKRTDGRVKVDFFPGAILTPPAQTYDSVVKGIADVGESFASYTAGRFPLTEVIDLPLGYTSAYQSTKLVNEFYKKFKPKEWDAVQVMFFHTAAPQSICTKKPINKLEDMKGLKIRATGTSAAIVQALGAAPVGMSMGEAYDAISRGVVNGVVCPIEATKGWKLGEVVSYCTAYESRHTNAAFVIMNKNKWNALPRDIQQIIEKINEEFIEKQGKLWDELDKEALDFFTQKNGTVIKLPAQEDARWKKQLQPILDDYVKSMKAKGLPGEEALKFALEYLKTH
jgi:TRAP-type C4-dicarboxylate transport system substrate-binding protein